jgi:hypothetical protein
MAITYKVLGQINPTANTQTTLYTVPAATSTIVSTVAICNLSATATTFSLAVQPAGAAIANKNYLNFNTPLPANDTITLTIGMTLATTDVISANAASSLVSFNAFGSELT